MGLSGLEERANEASQIVDKLLFEVTGLQKTVLEACKYSLMVGGKRVRPILMNEAYKMFGGNEEAHLIEHFMAAIEMIHTYSLVHDDLPAMDNDDYRRGQLTTHKKYGEDMGILAGDALLNYAFETVFKAGVLCKDQDNMARVMRAGQVLSTKAGVYGMIGGQTVDVEKTGKAINEEELEFIFRLKTSALIEGSLMCGAILAKASEEQVQLIEKVGYHVGMAFQIQDDILDVTSTTQELGKPVFSDEKNNKTTYVTTYGMDKALADVEYHSNEAIKILEKWENSEFLIEFVKYLIHRKK